MRRTARDRRSVLATIVAAGAGIIGAGLSALVGLVAAPRTAGHARRWRPAASIFDLPPKGPLPTVIVERHADGWFETRQSSVVYLDREGDGYRALSATCSHLGCRVSWDDARGQYLCPCHGGVYDREGRVVAGPPPAPLTRLAARVNPDTSNIEVEL
jgi:Rieske Fe-S protein